MIRPIYYRVHEMPFLLLQKISQRWIIHLFFFSFNCFQILNEIPALPKILKIY